MAEETVTVPAEPVPAEDVEDAPSTSADKTEGEDVDCEAKKLMGAGHRHLVMKDIKSAVAAFQEASSLLAKKFGDTADECADAFFSYGISLLELARMENGVLGNALEGIPEEEEEEKEETEETNVPAANLDEKEREQLREQVYDAMAEKSEEENQEHGDVKADEPVKAEGENEEPKADKDEPSAEEEDIADKGEPPATDLKETGDHAMEDKSTEASEKPEKANAEASEKLEEKANAEASVKLEEKPNAEASEKLEKANAEASVKPEEKPNAEASEKPEKPNAEASEKPNAEASEKPEEKANAEASEKLEKANAEASVKPEEKANAEASEKANAEASVKLEKANAEASEKANAEADPPVKPEETKKAEDKASEVAEREDEVVETDVNMEEAANKTPEKVSELESKVEEADAPKESEDKPKTESEAAEEEDSSAKTEETATKETGDDEEEETEEPMEGEDVEDSDENEGTEEKETEEEDVGNLQLAWEMLDLSKIIFNRQATKEAQLKAAQAHLKLGEVSVESENYTQAVEDFLACLKIQQEHLEPHDRLLAETHYQLGLAYQYSCKHEGAISHFLRSIDVIVGRITVLAGKMEATKDPDPELQKEIDELKNLLPDIREKIEDSKEAQKTAAATDFALKETLVGGSSGFSKENGSTSTSEKSSSDCTVPVQNCVSDISHLVRKKRKPEESPKKDSEAKKSKHNLVENGDGSGDAVVPTNEEAERAEAEQIPMETAAVESSA